MSRTLIALLIMLVGMSAQAAGSRAEAAQEALARHGGKVLAISEVERNDGRREFLVKLLADGRVRQVRVPAD
ncbi:MAG: hypothetical protein CSA54_01385 [Gammaproteobacteria bacterium]|nr:MAG: hypothetical protein CSA54_01385 [Gammaproteobacteria bacterium]